jgi:hypothetical protein
MALWAVGRAAAQPFDSCFFVAESCEEREREFGCVKALLGKSRNGFFDLNSVQGSPPLIYPLS